MRKYTRKSRRQNRKSRRQRKSGRRRGGTFQKMVGGEDPKISSDIYNYTISDLPHRVSA